MRLDKYLKISRLIKRRTIANDACDAGRVSLNGKTVKPAADVKVGDIIEIRFGNHLTKAEILSVNEKATKTDAQQMYRIIEES